jgi:carboxylesterase type B
VLASNENMVVITIQYRLGILGFFQTASTLDEAGGGAPGSAQVAGNQATRDVVQALTFIRKTVSSFAGDPDKVTVAGQSSGAHTVRALLSIPSASSLFARGLTHSDTTDFGISSQAVANYLGDQSLSALNCTDVACLRAASVEDVLGATRDLYFSTPGDNPAVVSGEPWRPVYGAYVTGELQDTVDTGGKSVLMTNVVNEGGPSLAGATNNQNVPAEQFDAYAAGLIGETRVGGNEGVLNATVEAYAPPPNSTAEVATEELEAIITDGTWRCGTQMLARDLVAKGGANVPVYLAQFVVGIQYPSNKPWDYCNAQGRVVSQPPSCCDWISSEILHVAQCHEDDIYVLFGTYPSDTHQQGKTLSTEVQARWASLARTGSPNSPGLQVWKPVASGEQLNLLVLGSGNGWGETVEASQRSEFCDGMWGDEVKFDWQLYPASG